MKNVTFKDTLFSIGRNAQDNWDTLDFYKTLDKDYWWFHLKSFPSPHVFVQAEEPTEDLVEHAAKLCRDNSKYARISEVKVCYTKCSNVIKDVEIGSVSFKSNRRVKEIKLYLSNTNFNEHSTFN